MFLYKSFTACYNEGMKPNPLCPQRIKMKMFLISIDVAEISFRLNTPIPLLPIKVFPWNEPADLTFLNVRIFGC